LTIGFSHRPEQLLTAVNNPLTELPFKTIFAMPILLFKTNIRLKKDLKKIRVLLNALPDITRWNVDQEDIDKVLRIEALKDNSGELIKIINQEGYLCEELPD
jgi:hypothetical protein